jgi:Heavy metal associated domain 2
MLDLALSAPETSEFDHPITKNEETSSKSRTRKPRMHLRSQVRGRQRWYVDALEDNARLAAAVELVLRSEEGIHGASVNPLTGRVLVHHDPELLPEIIEALIHRAIEFGPMSREEFSALRSDGHNHFLGAGHLIAAEIACSVIKMFLLGGGCQIGLAAGVLLLFHWRS